MRTYKQDRSIYRQQICGRLDKPKGSAMRLACQTRQAWSLVPSAFPKACRCCSSHFIGSYFETRVEQVKVESCHFAMPAVMSIALLSRLQHEKLANVHLLAPQRRAHFACATAASLEPATARLTGDAQVRLLSDVQQLSTFIRENCPHLSIHAGGGV